MMGVKSLSVWAGDGYSGVVAREAQSKYVFAYSVDSSIEEQVSLTMPLRLESWLSPGLHPIFQMNLPEGALLETIRRHIAKIIGDDDLSILRVTGGNQVGRNRFSLPEDARPCISETPESLEELIKYPDARELFNALVSKYALHSGISGIQPKVMLEASEKGTIYSGSYIVKSWGMDYPYLAANEFFCMTAAKNAGLITPEFFLSENGGLFIMRRFDFTDDKKTLGFEDMCSLQALGTAQKYRGSYERVAKSITDFISGECLMDAREQYFKTLVLSVMVRNGDAHLKNFGVLYPLPNGIVRLAPIYDIVTTTVYMAKDVPALSLSGTKKWWPRKVLESFAKVHLNLPIDRISRAFSETAEAVTGVQSLIPAYIKDHPEFQEIGELMIKQWNEGVNGLMAD